MDLSSSQDIPVSPGRYEFASIDTRRTVDGFIADELRLLQDTDRLYRTKEKSIVDVMLPATEDARSLVVRLNRVSGQMKGIQGMVLERRPCVEVLQQIEAARASLNRVSLEVFKQFLNETAESRPLGPDDVRCVLDLFQVR